MYVIFRTENDVLKGNLPLYHFERHCVELKIYSNDGNHIIYANGAYHNNSNDIGKLMHAFRCRNSEDMFYGPLREGVRYFKETEGGREQMSKDIEKYAEKKAAEAEVRGKILGTIDMLKDAGISEEESIKRVAAKYNVTEDYVRTLIHTAA